MEDTSLRNRIEHEINCCSAENGSSTPDFILADYLMASLRAFDAAVNAREGWYGRDVCAPMTGRGRVECAANVSLVSAATAAGEG